MAELAKYSRRLKTYQLFNDTAHGTAYIVNVLLIILIVLNVLAVFIASIPSVGQQYATAFYWFEDVSIALFTVEYIARVWSSAETDPAHPIKSRWRYMFTPLAIIDFIAVAPFYLGLFFQVDIRYLRAARLFRVLKLMRHSPSLNTLFQVLKNEGPTIFSALSILVLMIIFSSAAMYLVERKAQPDVFGSIPQAMWWASITLTTVGYGDVVPITIAGKILGVMITILGVGVAALPAGIIASGFNSEMRHRRDDYQAKVMSLMIDGKLTHDDLHVLEALRVKLNLSIRESKTIKRMAHYQHGQTHQNGQTHCKHCGEAWG